MPKQQDIRTLVDQFVSDLSARVREQALESVRAALGEGAAPVRRGPGRPRGSGKRLGPGRPRKAAKRGPGRPPKAARRGPGRPRKAGRRARRSSADLEATAAKVLAYVRSNAGQRLEEIGKGLRTATAGLKRPIQVLVAEGKLRTEGQKRGTRYFAGGRGGSKRGAGKKAGRKAKGRRAAKRGKRKARRAPRRSKATRKRGRRVAKKAPRRATRRAKTPARRKSAKSRPKALARRKITKKVRRVMRKVRKALEPKPSAELSVPLLPEPGTIL